MGDQVLLDVAVRPWQLALEDLGFPLAAATSAAPRASELSVLWLNGDGVAKFEWAVRNARLREGLALFERLSRVDRRAWQRALSDSWRSALTTWSTELMEDTQDVAQRSTSLGVVLTVDSAEAVARLRAVPSTQGASSTSTIQALCDVLGGDMEFKVARVLPVRLVVDCRRGDYTEVTAVLASVLSLVQSMQEAPELQRRWWWIHEITIESHGIEAKALPYLEAISRLGVIVPVLPTIHLDTESSRSFHGATQVLRSMLLGSSTSSAHTLVASQPELAALLLSCAQVSHDVKTVQLQLWGTRRTTSVEDLVQQQALWRWVSYSLLSRDARHRIDRLSTNFNHLRMAHVDVVRLILDAEDPLSELFQLPTPRVRFVLASRFYLQDPHVHGVETSNDPSVPAVFEPNLPLKVRVIERTDGVWWRVLLPGRGPAWVHNDDVVERTQVDDISAPNYTHISELVIESMDDQSMDAVVAFIRLLGPQLRCIQLNSYYAYQPLSAWCRDVISVCPNLHDLRFGSANFDSLDVFVDCAITGPCKLKRLEISSQMRSPIGVVRLLNSLTDRNNRLTQSLQHLKLAEIVVNDRDIPDVVAAARRLLAQNRLLHTIDWHFVHDITSSSRGWAVDLFSLGDAAEEPVLVPAAALSMRQRLALITVTNIDQRRLDANTLTLIILFAGDCRARRVELRHHESIWAGMAG